MWSGYPVAYAEGHLPAAVVQVPLQRVLVVFDDMDVPNGTVRLRAKGGHGGHNGMRSITQHFSGSKDFPRLRLGMPLIQLLDHFQPFFGQT